jgi:glycosyltransferase involved in cell wall biosynthesis
MDAHAAPSVSIGLPVYNGVDFLRESIQSLLAQTWPDFELIISDNASTDGTQAVCAEFAARDPRIRYDRLASNIGGVANHNRVARMARGRYFMWASSDDQWHPDYLRRAVEILETDPAVVVAYAQNGMINERGKQLGVIQPGSPLDGDDVVERFRLQTEIYRTIEPFYGLIRRTALEKAAPMPRHPGFDRILFAELGLLGKMRQIPEPLYVRRIHAGQSVGTHPSLRSRYRWISPNRSPRWVWPHFEYAAHFAAAALRSAPSQRVRARCLWHLFKWFNWHRRQLWNDVLGRD